MESMAAIAKESMAAALEVQVQADEQQPSEASMRHAQAAQGGEDAPPHTLASAVDSVPALRYRESCRRATTYCNTTRTPPRVRVAWTAREEEALGV